MSHQRVNRLVSPVSLILAALTLLTVAPALAESEAPGKVWNFLPSSEIGAQAFREANPEWDGRGVVVAILDTGVDAFAPGMLKTTNGQTKLIDVRDFSTEGDWETAVAETDDSSTDAAPVYKTEDGHVLRGIEHLAVAPADGAEVYIGVIAEMQFVNNADVYDLNDDGDTTDKFGFLVYAADRKAVEAALGVGNGYELLSSLNETAKATVEKERLSSKVWLVVVDTDGDGDLGGEAQLRDYHVNHDAFALGSDNNPDSRAIMAWEVNVLANEDQIGNPEPPTIEFHFDDGSHGSHCAGIAAGFEVSGQAGMHGAAPGAYVISCKLGDNRLAGGATRTSSMKRAYEYAASFEEKYGIPVVVNMSFGINSVEEGDDSMGRWLDDLLAEHPTLYACTSAGNSGPGLSTVGLPATSYSLISSGAYLSKESGADLYNANMAQASLFNFSSRGGESNKPDIVAPGTALSTVPGFIDGMARFNGTSMASPQTAGAVACLLSAAKSQDLKVHWGMIKRALIAGGSPVPGLELTDQGGGLVNTAGSWKVLQQLAKSESAHQVLWYKISTASPLQDDGQSEAAYWRTPGGVPFDPETITFTVEPVFHPDLGPDQKDTFFRSFNFKSEVPWIKIVSGDRYIRGDMGMTVAVRYDGSKLAKPGRYSGRVIGSLSGGDLGGLAGREFYLWNTVVTGDAFGPTTGYHKTYDGKDLIQSATDHYYVDVPPGATAMRVRLEVSKDVGSSRGSRVLTEICDPEGQVRGGFSGYASIDGQPIRDTNVYPPELVPGTWEINVSSSITAADLSNYRLSVSFDGYQTCPGKVTKIGRKAAGKAAKGDLKVTRTFPGVFQGSVKPVIEGFRETETVEIEDADEWTHDFTLDTTTPRAEFTLIMDDKVGNLFTDCAVNILDSNGEVVRAGSFNALEAHTRASLPEGADTAKFTLQVVGAFAIAPEMEEWGLELTGDYFFAHPVAGQAKRKDGGDLKFYSGMPAEISLKFEDAWPDAPSGMQVFGAVRFEDTKTSDRRPGDQRGRMVLEVPIVLD